MATNSHLQRGAQRRMATMFLLAAAIGGGALAGRTALPAQTSTAASTPQASSATASSSTVGPSSRSTASTRSAAASRIHAPSSAATDRARPHDEPLRLLVPPGDRHPAADGTDVYAVRSGVVRIVTPDWVEVDSDGGSAFQYWHIRSAVKVGDHVQARQTVLGQILHASKHVHLTELQNGKPTNPLAPGHIGPYADSTTPRVNTITFRCATAGHTSCRNTWTALSRSWQPRPKHPPSRPRAMERVAGDPIEPDVSRPSFPHGQNVILETTSMDVSRNCPPSATCGTPTHVELT